MVRATPFNLLIGLLAAAGAAKAATSLPMPHRGASASVEASAEVAGARVILASAGTEEEGAPAAAVASSAARVKAPDAPAKCDTPEVLMQSIRQERALIARQKAALADREARLALARQGVDAETKRLEALRTEVQGLLTRATGAHDADLARLVKLYQAMKPQAAAGILDNADLEVTVMVLATMTERNAAAIMAKMTPSRVQAVSKIILERSKLPGDQNVVRVQLD